MDQTKTFFSKMYSIKIFTAGKIKETWLSTALEEYEKRLKPHCKIQWVVTRTDKELLELLSKESSFVCLDSQGKQLNSTSFSKSLFTLLEKEKSRLNFVIGGFEGIDPEISKKSIFKFSLSLLTFTSQMTRVIFLEQIYRAFQIALNTKYHR